MSCLTWNYIIASEALLGFLFIRKLFRASLNSLLRKALFYIETFLHETCGETHAYEIGPSTVAFTLMVWKLSPEKTQPDTLQLEFKQKITMAFSRMGREITA